MDMTILIYLSQKGLKYFSPIKIKVSKNVSFTQDDLQSDARWNRKAD